MDFEKLWNRVKFDYKKDHFLKNTTEMNLVEKDFDSWSESLASQFEGGNYIPKSTSITDVPKSKGLIRPGVQLSVSDYTYYIHLVSQCYDKIFENLEWSQQNKDYAYILTGNNETAVWLKNHFHGWAPFRQKAIDFIEEGYPYVIITDITGCYENIDHQTLLSDLREIEISQELSTKIIQALRTWAIVTNKGIPQSCSASHILAKVYMNPIDLALVNRGYEHIRYVDDIRIFCKTKKEAKEALIYLTKLLRDRGLSLNSSKTGIYTADEAKEIIDGVQTTITRIINKLKSENSTFDFLEYFDGDYYDEDDIKELIALNENPTEDSIEVIQETFRAFFEDSKEPFDKTLFRFLLSRLGEAENDFAKNYCIHSIENRPEETSTILNYWKACNSYEIAINAILKYFVSKQNVYDYQNHKILDWIFDNYAKIPNELMPFIRDFALNGNHPEYLRISGLRALGKYGNIADLKSIQNRYKEVNSEYELAEIILAMKRMEVGRRNGFYKQIEEDNNWNKTAIKIAKQ
jgi:hypothetical protein